MDSPTITVLAGEPMAGEHIVRTPIDPALFRRQLFSGNPPHAPNVCGFVIRFTETSRTGLPCSRPATPIEHTWLRAHGYRFSGGKWCRADRRPARSVQPSWDWEAWCAQRTGRSTKGS